MKGGKGFAKLGVSDAYLTIGISEESRELQTINTQRGLFQHTRLPFDVKSAPAIFEQVTDTMLQGIPYAAAYLIDVISWDLTRRNYTKEPNTCLTG